MKIAKEDSVEGDGYSKNFKRPSTSEYFHGVTLGRAALMVKADMLDIRVLKDIFNVTDFSRQFLEDHFKLENRLYFSFTHLVCRSSRPNKEDRLATDLSHKIHVDNCILQSNDDCLKIPPAYTFRDYSAILYLNEDFRGGEFIFSKDRTGSTYQSMVEPECGHLVGFSAGPENPHGVLPVTFGSRCALAMWFTFDKKHREVEREMTQSYLKSTNAKQCII